MTNDLLVLSVFCPFLALLFFNRDIHWETIDDFYPLLLLPAFFFAMAVAAAIIARRYKFSKYRLEYVDSAHAAFFGFLFFWIFAVWWFLENLPLVRSGAAQPLVGPGPKGKGILLPCLVWSIVWFLLVGFQLPSTIQSPMRVHELEAILMLRRYADAQTRFLADKLAEVPGNAGAGAGYCDNFRNLFYGKDEKGEPLALIPREMADAFAGPGTPAPGGATAVSKSFKGYVYLEDPFIVNRGLWGSRYGLVAYPIRPGGTGTKLLWIGEDGTVLSSSCWDREHTLLREDQSPLHPKGRNLWALN